MEKYTPRSNGFETSDTSVNHTITHTYLSSSIVNPLFAKRIFDLMFILPGIIAILPVFLGIILLIKRNDSGPILFKQIRVGQHGKQFKVLKFRTMIVDAEKQGPKVTTGKDSRITQVGHYLRKYKLDELPQLFNVLKGDMSLVGPRPEVPEYVEFYSEKQKEVVLSIPPGITDLASIEFRNENELLTNSSDPVEEYKEKVLPIKLAYYEEYVSKRSLLLDFKIILKTLSAIIKP